MIRQQSSRCDDLSKLLYLFQNNYQNELSEKYVGEWMKTRNNRDHIVLATK